MIILRFNLVTHLLNQIYVVPITPPQYDYYDDSHANVTDELILSTWHLCFHLQHDVLYTKGLII